MVDSQDESRDSRDTPRTRAELSSPAKRMAAIMRESSELSSLSKRMTALAYGNSELSSLSKRMTALAYGNSELTSLSKRMTAIMSGNSELTSLSQRMTAIMRENSELTSPSQRMAAIMRENSELSSLAKRMTALAYENSELTNLSERMAAIIRDNPELARLSEQIDEQLAGLDLPEEEGLDDAAESDVLPAGKHRRAFAFVLALYVYAVLVGIDILVLDEGHPVVAKMIPDADLTVLIMLFVAVHEHLKRHEGDSTSSEADQLGQG
ncbi:hypothetical protein [Janibacter melonis]|uniref:hypothetical protein n=1 Tax=Janibacter melonis TaxID=262209 RepID=UPI00191879D2|nr:hypothetical protein [Janibacter melonis]